MPLCACLSVVVEGSPTLRPTMLASRTRSIAILSSRRIPLIAQSAIRPRTPYIPVVAQRCFSGTAIANSSNEQSHAESSPFIPDSAIDTFAATDLVSLASEPTQVNALLASTHYILEGIHNAGLPWWATIFTATFLLRTAITTPVAIYQQRAIGRMMALTPVLQAWLQTLKTSVSIDHKLKGRDYATFNAEIQNAV